MKKLSHQLNPPPKKKELKKTKQNKGDLAPRLPNNDHWTRPVEHRYFTYIGGV